MKKYFGTAKVKDDSIYIYRGLTLDIIGISADYKNGSGVGVYADGTREYKLSLIGHGLTTREGTVTVLHDCELEDIKLFECIELPLNESEAIALMEFTLQEQKELFYIDILSNFLKNSVKPSILPTADLTTLYDEDKFGNRI